MVKAISIGAGDTKFKLMESPCVAADYKTAFSSHNLLRVFDK